MKKLTEQNTTVQTELSKVKEDAKKDRAALQLKLDQLSKEKDAAVQESARLKTARDSLEKKLGETTTDLTKAQACLKTSEATSAKLGKELESTKTELSSVRKELSARAALSQTRWRRNAKSGGWKRSSSEARSRRRRRRFYSVRKV